MILLSNLLSEDQVVLLLLLLLEYFVLYTISKLVEWI